MKNDLAQLWNLSSERIPEDKDPSQYAIEKEKLFPRNAFVCDLGGGTGADTIYFLSKGHTVHLVDISDTALSGAQQRAKALGLAERLTTEQWDFSGGELPFPENYYDVVYARLSLHYFPENVTADLFSEIYQSLTLGGAAYITMKSPMDRAEMDYLKKTAQEISLGVFEDKGQIKTRFGKEQLEKLLAKIGVEDFTVEDYTEKLDNRNDQVRSGNEVFLLTEVIIRKLLP